MNYPNQFRSGDKARFSKTITESDVSLFAGLVGDFHPKHINAVFGAQTAAGKRVAQHALMMGLVNAVLQNQLPGVAFELLRQQAEFLTPVCIGDTVTAIVEIVNWQPEKRLITLKTLVVNQDNVEILTGEAVMISQVPLQDKS
ncbi:MAG: enoyl-CoA hydratase [Chloroflexi bacterium HGW-Chloroflexi-10]|nr:MAG: enoyl-CoA hydratase [Chloroflexi bacterium HGW-Chloroflexi-10]